MRFILALLLLIGLLLLLPLLPPVIAAVAQVRAGGGLVLLAADCHVSHMDWHISMLSEERHPFWLEFSLCSSRACLGSFIASFSRRKWRKRAFFLLLTSVGLARTAAAQPLELTLQTTQGVGMSECHPGRTQQT